MEIKFILPDVHLTEGESSKIPLLDSYGFSRDVLIQYAVLNHFLGYEKSTLEFMEYVSDTLENLGENGDIEKLGFGELETLVVSAGVVYGTIVEQLKPHFTTIEDTIRQNLNGADLVDTVTLDHYNRGSTMAVIFTDT